MDSKRFDGLVRSVGQTRSRRQTLRRLAGAGALLALLAAKPVAADKTGKPNKAPKNPGKGQPGGSQPGPLGGGQNGSPGPSPDCEDQCFRQVGQCRVRCADATCREACESLMDECEQRCL